MTPSQIAHGCVERNGLVVCPRRYQKWICQDGERICKVLFVTHVDPKSHHCCRHSIMVIPEGTRCAVGETYCLEEGYTDPFDVYEIKIRWMEPCNGFPEVMVGYTLWPNDPRTISLVKFLATQYPGEVWID